MGFKPKTIGGGKATGLADELIAFLQPLITSGSFGGGTSIQQYDAANPGGDTANIFGLLNSLISNPQADQSVQTLINKDIERGRNDLRARFGSQGGMAFGSPAAVAEGIYQAEQAPRTSMALDQMRIARLGALVPLFQAIYGLSQKGIPQAETTLEPKPWLQGVNLLLDVANTAANFIPGGGGGKTDRSSKSPTNAKYPPWTGGDGSDKDSIYGPAVAYNPSPYNPYNFYPLPMGQQVYV